MGAQNLGEGGVHSTMQPGRHAAGVGAHGGAVVDVVEGVVVELVVEVVDDVVVVEEDVVDVGVVVDVVVVVVGFPPPPPPPPLLPFPAHAMVGTNMVALTAKTATA